MTDRQIFPVHSGRLSALSKAGARWSLFHVLAWVATRSEAIIRECHDPVAWDFIDLEPEGGKTFGVSPAANRQSNLKLVVQKRMAAARKEHRIKSLVNLRNALELMRLTQANSIESADVHKASDALDLAFNDICQNICSSKLNAVVVPTGAIFDRHQIAAVRLATDGNELRFPSGVDDLIFERTQVRMLWPEGGDGIALTAARKGIAEKHVSPTERKRPISESRLVKWIASFDCAELEVLGKDDIWKRAKAKFPNYVISRQRVRDIVGARKSGPKPSRGKVTAS